MPSPRLKGPALDLALRAAATPPGAALIRRIAFNDYKMARLLSVPAASLPALDHEPRPIAGGAPRQWGDQGLGTPTPTGHRRGSRELVAAYTDGATKPSDVLAALFAAIDSGRLGSVTFSPYIGLDRERAAADALAADARYAAGAPRGPLDGVPIPVKDEVDVEGMPTFGGTVWRRDALDSDGFAVRALRAAGAIVYGKTHTTEWGMSPVGINPHWDMPRNAYAADRAPGGSSSGTGAAVALGHATVGLGSDGGGSIRIPSSLQGVFGLKPSFARIGRSGDVFGLGTVAVLGPLAQTAAALADFLAATGASPDPEDYACGYAPVGNPVAAWERAIGRGVRGARIGVPRQEWADADPRVADVCLAALRALEAEGARLVDVELEHASVAQGIGVLSIGSETKVHLADFLDEHGDVFGGELRMQMAILGTVSAQEYLHAQRVRAALRRSTAATLSTVDVLALPTLPITAPKYPVGDNRVHVADDEATRLLCRFAFLANLCGLPAGSAPVGMVDGLPVGLQIVGDAWDEASVLAMLAHVERIGASDLPAPLGYFDPLA
ncbi:MAG: amidase [Myxococcales bacterium]|nr:amidase [Myxococcales bacterium]MCB9530829.1 amidase [Myxococcales bacterium]